MWIDNPLRFLKLTFAQQCAASALHLVLVFVAVPELQAQLAPRLDVIAVTGDVLPDGGPGTYETVLLPPMLNDQGDATVYATLTDTGTLGDRALFRGNASGLTQVIRFGDPIPGVTETFQGLRSTLLNNNGQIASEGGTNGPADNMILIFDDTAGAQIVAKVGDPPPVGSGNYVDFGEPTFNGVGNVAFAVSFTRFGSPSSGVYTGNASGLTEIQRGALHGEAKLNDSGQIFFNVQGSGSSMSFYDGANVNLVAGNGDPIPGGAGTLAGTFSNASINESGQFAIAARVTPAGGGFTHTGLFFFDPDTGLTDALPLDTPAPDGNGTFDNIGRPFLNDAGVMAFSATLANTAIGSGDDTAVYLLDGPGGTLTTVAHEFERPPNQDGFFDRFFGIAVNELGHAAFRARLRSQSYGTGDAIYFYDPARGLTEIIRVGDPFLGSTLASFIFESGNDALAGSPANEGNGFNNLDEIAFAFRLADGRQGVAITTVVPEPSSIVCLALAALGLCLIPRQRVHWQTSNPIVVSCR